MSLIPAFHLPGKVNVNLSSVLEQILDDRGAACNVSSPYESSYQLFRIILDIWLASCVCILGFLGNALTIVILLSDKDRRTPTNWLLQWLAAVDIVYLINSIFIQPLKTANDVTDWLHPAVRSVLTHLEPYLWTMASTVQMVTVWTVLLVTLDRYIAICHPTKARLRTLDRARKSVASILVVAVVYNLPLLFERQASPIATTREASCQPTQALALPYTDLRRSFLYFVVYKTIFFFVFRTIGPLLTLVTLNVKLMTAVRRMRRRHSHMTNVTRQRQNVTVTLVVVVSVFIVCELPDICLRIFVTVLEMAPQFAEIYHVSEVIRYVVHPVTNILLTVNSSVNFVIYCLMAKKFRLILLRICCQSRSVHCRGRTSLSGVWHYHHVTGGQTYAMTVVARNTAVAGKEAQYTSSKGR